MLKSKKFHKKWKKNEIQNFEKKDSRYWHKEAVCKISWAQGLWVPSYDVPKSLVYKCRKDNKDNNNNNNNNRHVLDAKMAIF